jgi:hypothetical protein
MCAHNETLMMENKSLPPSQNVCLAATEIASKFSHQKCIWKFGLRGQGSLPIDFFKIVATKDPDLVCKAELKYVQKQNGNT